MMQYAQPGLSRGVIHILGITLAVYILQVIPGLQGVILHSGGLIPSRVFSGFEIWRVVTYLFIHGGVWHLFFNLLALVMLGPRLEERWGYRRFISFYAIAGIGSALFSVITWNALIIGASGAILGLCTMFAFYYPETRFLLFFIFPVKARWAVAVIGMISVLGAAGGESSIAHLTHLGGILAALAYIKMYDPVITWFDHRRGLHRERTVRKTAERRAHEEQYFTETVDTILKKINESGMESLTEKEREILLKASRRQKKKQGSSRIIPFRRAPGRDDEHQPPS